MDSEGASPPWGQSGFFDGLIRMPLLKDAAAPKPLGGAGWPDEKKPGARRNADRAENVKNRSKF